MKWNTKVCLCSGVFFLLLNSFVAEAEDGLFLIQNSKTKYVIVIPGKANATEEKAAYELQRLLNESSGVVLPVIRDNVPASEYEIIIGSSARLQQKKIKINFFRLKEDGFTIRTTKKALVISGGTGKGTLYGVYTFLEKYIGFRFYSPDHFYNPKKKNIHIPFIKNDTQVPVIEYRASHYRNDSGNDFFRDWHKLTYQQSSDDLPGWGLFVHTFNQLVPPSVYYKTNPEYYALVKGKRVPTQLCLSNPQVFTLLTSNLKKLIVQKPEAKYWSVSQNDNNSFCTCMECKKIDKEEGGPSGSIIRFVNAVAARFPDKIISTLAYQYSRQAPQKSKPAKNVNIMFCSIECNRSEPVATGSSSASFRKDMKDWSRLTDDIFVWDYVIQFKNLLSPFPNLFVLQPNMQFFQNHAKAMFMQGNRERGGEFAALRQYMIAKLLWDPNADIRATMNDFLKGNFGNAWKTIRAYIDTMQYAMSHSGKRLDIFGSPVEHSENGYMSSRMIRIYTALFNRAEQEVKDDSVSLLRVQEASMPLDYAVLTIAGSKGSERDGYFEKVKDTLVVKKEIRSRLENFYRLCRQLGVTRLHEWDTTPDEFYAMTLRVFKNNFRQHLAYHKPVEYKSAYDTAYTGGGTGALTDAVFGTNEYRENWQGYVKEDMNAVIDLGEVKEIHTINATFLQLTDDWIFLPDEVVFYTSGDGQTFTFLEEIRNPVAEKRPFVIKDFASGKYVKARYIRVLAKNKGLCPDWHAGAGSPCWLFIDEIAVW